MFRFDTVVSLIYNCGLAASELLAAANNTNWEYGHTIGSVCAAMASAEMGGDRAPIFPAFSSSCLVQR